MYIYSNVIISSKRDSSVSTVTGLQVGQLNSREGKNYFRFTTASEPALGPTQQLT